jgi:hypothetical protein
LAKAIAKATKVAVDAVIATTYRDKQLTSVHELLEKLESSRRYGLADLPADRTDPKDPRRALIGLTTRLRGYTGTSRSV